MKFLIYLSVLLAQCPLLAKNHKYSFQNQNFEGQYFPAATKNAPGIVLIHNWMGVSTETEKQALRFQKLGYNVLVADIYGAGVRPKDAKEAGTLAGKYKSDRSLLRERVSIALKELTKQPQVDGQRLAVIGYCFGGTAAIESARNGENLRAVISFHGGLDSPTPNDGAKIHSKVLALHGAIDPYVSAKDVEAFETEMQTSKADYQLVKFGGAVHSFTDLGAGTDISKGAAYNQKADERSFVMAREFLAEAFK